MSDPTFTGFFLGVGIGVAFGLALRTALLACGGRYQRSADGWSSPALALAIRGAEM